MDLSYHSKVNRHFLTNPAKQSILNVLGGFYMLANRKIFITAGLFLLLATILVSIGLSTNIFADTNPTNKTAGIPKGYTARELPTNLYAHYIATLNDKGDIITSYSSTNFYDPIQATIYTKNNEIKRLGSLPPETTSNGVDINNAGKVVGGAGTNRNFIWENGTMKDIADLFSTSGTFRVMGINDHSVTKTNGRSNTVVKDEHIIGSIQTEGDSVPSISVRWSKLSGLKEITSGYNSYPSDVNDNGDVIGYSSSEGYLYTDQGGLKKLSNFIPRAINNSGNYIGVDLGASYPYTSYFVTKSGTKTKIAFNNNPAFNSIYANDINDDNIIVGRTSMQTTFVASMGTKEIKDLRSLVSNLPSDMNFTDVAAINNTGQIIVTAYQGSVTPYPLPWTRKMYILTPSNKAPTPTGTVSPSPSVKPSISPSPSVRPSTSPSPSPRTR